MTVGEFLAWERGQELRCEFDGYQSIAMTGGTIEHSEIATNVVIALRERLRGGPCRVVRGDVKIIVAGRVRYPDVAVTCSPIDPGSDLLPNPVVLFEVLSASTERTDRTVKNDEYGATPSVQRYIVLEQTRRAVTVVARDGDDWTEYPIITSGTLAMPEIYAGVVEGTPAA